VWVVLAFEQKIKTSVAESLNDSVGCHFNSDPVANPLYHKLLEVGCALQ